MIVGGVSMSREYVVGRCQGPNVVLHLDATAHYGSDNADSYVTYRGRTGDFGQMGSQSWSRPRHRPYSAGAVALDCATASGGCPSRIPSDYLP